MKMYNPMFKKFSLTFQDAKKGGAKEYKTSLFAKIKQKVKLFANRLSPALLCSPVREILLRPQNKKETSIIDQPIPIYTRPNFIPDEIGYAFWEIPTFIGNNPSTMVEIIETNGKYVFPCDIKVWSLGGQPLSVKGIFDTGATKTCITPKLIKALKLKQNGIYDYTAMGGKRTSPKYPLMLSIDGVSAEFQLNVGDVGFDIDGIDVLIGLDVICHGELYIKKQSNGKYSLKFDVPLLPIELFTK